MRCGPWEFRGLGMVRRVAMALMSDMADGS